MLTHAVAQQNRIFESAKRTILHKLHGATYTDYSPKGSIDAPVRGLVDYLNTLDDYVTLSSCSGRIAVYGYVGGSERGPSSGLLEAAAASAAPAAASSSTKGAGRWLFVSHHPLAGCADEHSPLFSLAALQQCLREGVAHFSTETADATAMQGGAAASASGGRLSAYLKVEPLILHVQARTIQAARVLHQLAMQAGFRESGIGIGAATASGAGEAGELTDPAQHEAVAVAAAEDAVVAVGKIVVAIRSTASSLEVPLFHQGVDLAGLLQADGAGNTGYAGYGASLVDIARERFAEVEERRQRFIDALLRARLRTEAEASGVRAVAKAKAKAAAKAAAQAKSGAWAGAADKDEKAATPAVPVACAGCGAPFASKTALYNAHLVPDRAGKKKCPHANTHSDPPASAAPSAAAATAATAAVPCPAAVPTPAPSAPAPGCCALCGGGPFASRNRLFAHLHSDCPARPQGKTGEQGGRPMAPTSAVDSAGSAAVTAPVSAAEATRWQSTALDSTDGAAPFDLIFPSDPAAITEADVATRRRCRAAARRLLDAVAAHTRSLDGVCAACVRPTMQAAASPNAGDTGSAGLASVRFSRVSAAKPQRNEPGVDAASAPEQHLARWGHTATPLQSAADGGCVLVCGGYSGVALHSRTRHCLVMDMQTRAWSEPDLVGADGSSLPPPRMRHSAVPIPVPATNTATQTEVAFIWGGHNGPAKPLSDAWWARVTGHGAGTDAARARVEWTPVTVTNGPQCPDAPSPRWAHSCVRISPTQVLVYGGRDAQGSFNDAFIGTFSPAASPELAALPCLTWRRVVPGPGGAVPSARFCHSAAAISLSSAPGNAANNAATHVLVHGGYRHPHMFGDRGRFPQCVASASTPVEAVDAERMVFGADTQLLDDIFVLNLSTLEWFPVLLAPGSATPGGRMSHSLLALPPCKTEQTAELLMLGGECSNVEYNSAFSLRVTMAATTTRFTAFWARLDDNASYGRLLLSQSEGSVSIRDKQSYLDPFLHPGLASNQISLPFCVRSAACFIPALASTGTKSASRNPAEVLLTGGGGHVFVFGSFFQTSCVGTLGFTSPIHNAFPPSSRTDAAAMLSASVCNAFSSSPKDTDAIRKVVQDVGIFDWTRKCAPLPEDAATAQMLMGIPVDTNALRTLVETGGARLEAIMDLIVAGRVRLCSVMLPAFTGVSKKQEKGEATLPLDLRDLRTMLLQLLQEMKRDTPENRALLEPGAIGGLPLRLEYFGGILMLPPNGLTHKVWATLCPAEAFWDRVARATKVTRIARRSEIDSGPTRASRVQLLRSDAKPGAFALPDRADMRSTLPAASGTQPQCLEPASKEALDAVDATSAGWVCIKENGLSYFLDCTRLMFSSGNVTEKARMARMNAKGETVVDLFAGIGYFTIPLLVHAGAAFVHACDWNADAIACLRLNLAANGIDKTRALVYPGDNTGILTFPGLPGSANRIMLGLIPTSSLSWPVAVRLLKDTGGWLHVHENVHESLLPASRNPSSGATAADRDHGQWVKETLLPTLQRLALEAGRPAKWSFHCSHLELVKSYAPKVWHIVADIRVTLSS